MTHAGFHQRGFSPLWHKDINLLTAQSCWTDLHRTRITFMIVTPWELDFLLSFRAKQRIKWRHDLLSSLDNTRRVI